MIEKIEGHKFPNAYRILFHPDSRQFFKYFTQEKSAGELQGKIKEYLETILDEDVFLEYKLCFEEEAYMFPEEMVASLNFSTAKTSPQDIFNKNKEKEPILSVIEQMFMTEHISSIKIKSTKSELPKEDLNEYAKDDEGNAEDAE